MNAIRILSGLALVLLWTGCGSEPTTPSTEPDLTPQFAAVHDGFSETWSAEGDIWYLACANDGMGEDVQWSGEFDVHYRIVLTPSGNELWSWKLGYSPDFGFVGLTSGDEWSLVQSGGGGHMAVKDGCGFNEHWTNIELYENQDGDRLLVQFLHQVTVSPDCEVRVDRDFAGCPGGS